MRHQKAQNAKSNRRFPLAGLIEIGLLALIAFVVVKAVITYVSPQSVWKPVVTAQPGEAGPAPIAAPALNLNFDPFYRQRAAITAAPAVTIGEDAPETSLDLKLFGLRADSADETGSAILETPDRKQKTYRVGDEIISGVVLRAVTKSYIVLDAEGSLERLTFIKPESALNTPAPAPSEPAQTYQAGQTGSAGAPSGRLSVQNFSAAQFMAAVRLTPDLKDGSVRGIKITPRGSGKLLSGAGLQSGDIITAVNGQSVTDNQAMMRMASVLSRDQGASLSILRNDIPMTVKVGR